MAEISTSWRLTVLTRASQAFHSDCNFKKHKKMYFGSYTTSINKAVTHSTAYKTAFGNFMLHCLSCVIQLVPSHVPVSIR